MRKLSRIKKTRRHLLRSLLNNLLQHGKLTSIRERVKEVKREFDKLVTKAQKGTQLSFLHSYLKRSNYERLLAYSEAISERSGGYLKYRRLGLRRGNSANLSEVRLIE